MTINEPIVIFWHRRDLRIADNAGLYHALSSGFKVIPLFIFDSLILDKLENKHDARVEFIHRELAEIKSHYEQNKGSLIIRTGNPLEVFDKLFSEFNIEAVYANKDYEPYARQRDQQVEALARSKGAGFRLFKDHVIFEENEVLKNDGTPYTVFTPYMKRWKETLGSEKIKAFNSQELSGNLYPLKIQPSPTLKEIGFMPAGIELPDKEANLEIISKYHQQRNTPAIKGTTRLGIHLRFGTVSTRELVKIAAATNETWLNELIWREFFQMILYHFPHTVNKSFKPAYDRIQWANDEAHFKAWCEGKTGFPIVDAGLRELAATGFMHNRVRMIAGSFLVKDLLIDWRWGEAWFAEKLLDYEQASNVGNWQWVAGCGCDATPYFRVFNPELQAQKFDPNGEYIRKWIPELATPEYPKPIIEHKFAKERVIRVFKEALAG